MTMAWGSLLVVCVVSLAIGVAVVALVAFALVGLSARARVPAGGPDDGTPSLSPTAGSAVAGVCLLAVAAIVGNEDGAHHVSAEVYQSLSDVGFTIPAQAVTYWVGEAMQATDYQDLDEVPEKTAVTTSTLAANAVNTASENR